MKKALLVLGFLLGILYFLNTAWAQDGWLRVFQQEDTIFLRGKAIAGVSEDEFLLAGRNPEVLWLLSSNGTILWTESFEMSSGPSDYWKISALMPFGDHDFYAAGRANVRNIDFWIMFFQRGDLIWSKVYGGDVADILHQARRNYAGHVVAVGETYSYTLRAGDIWFLEVNAQGSIVRQEAIGTSYYETVNDFLVEEDGYLLVGTYREDNNDSDLLVLKLDTSGNLLWAKTYDAGESETGRAVVRVSNGYVIVGRVGNDLLVVKLGGRGEVIWQKRYDAGGQEVPSGVVADFRNGILISGADIAHEFQAFLLKIGPDGAILDQKTFQERGTFALQGRKDGYFWGVGSVNTKALALKIKESDTIPLGCEAYFGQGSFQVRDLEMTFQERKFSVRETSARPRSLENQLGPQPIKEEDLCGSCRERVPDPVIVFRGIDEKGRYLIPVLNWVDYPASLFVPSPELPPCGLNTSASRTWVDIYDQNDLRLYGFCAFGDPKDLYRIWFSSPASAAPPSAVKVVLNDRLCEKLYESEPISLPRAPLGLVTVKANGMKDYAQIELPEGRLRLTVSLEIRNPTVSTGDYFLWAKLPGGECYCYGYPYGWYACNCDLPGAAYSGNLVPLSDFEVVNMACQGLPAGRYLVIFAVDTFPDGYLAPDALKDFVWIEMTPAARP